MFDRALYRFRRSTTQTKEQRKRIIILSHLSLDRHPISTPPRAADLVLAERKQESSEIDLKRNKAVKDGQ